VTKKLDTCTVADAYLALLADRGVSYFFANAGTDFTPIIEAFAKAETHGKPSPKPIAVPHENVAMACAMGYTMATGRPQVVMVHTNVGTANALCQMLNVNRLKLPMIVTAGRTPFSEDDRLGGRSIDIHWTQEMFDQAGMVREAVKWDYELRDGNQLRAVVDRALNMAEALPSGPVYLTLPREVLAKPMEGFILPPAEQHVTASDSYPDPNVIDKLADAVAKAKSPVIVTSEIGNRPEAVDALAKISDEWAIPVTQYRPRTMNLSTDHSMHMGYNPALLIREADLILAIECEVPWIPRLAKPPNDCRVAQIGVDPLYATAPHRGFRADFVIGGPAEITLSALSSGLDGRRTSPVDDRLQRLEDTRAALHRDWQAELERSSDLQPISLAKLSRSISNVLDDDAIVVREAALDLRYVDRRRPRTLFGGASGLGWGLGGAIGAKLAAPNSLVVACEGDGAYMFSNPVSSHYVAAAHDAPFLTIIFNNQRWESVGRATRAMYPDGYAGRSNNPPLTNLQPSPSFEKVVTASDGYGEKVTDPGDLNGALERALKAVSVEGRQAVLNVLCDD
jgi:acetolactate synthase-1/2/3 large subunit